MVLILAHLSGTILDELAAAQDCIVVGSVPREAADQLICVSQYLVVTIGLVAIRVSKRRDYGL